MKKLIEGYREFYKEYFESGNMLYKSLHSEGQFPKALVIACSDSRVDPSILMQAEPGDIFAIRNVANIVPPYQPDDESLHGVSSAVEFAVRFLEVKDIVVLGHSECAGVNALLHPEVIKESDFIGPWMNIAKPARDTVLKDKRSLPEADINNCCEKEVIKLSLSNLTKFPWIKEKVENKHLRLHGWHFDLSNGKIAQYNPKLNEFVEIK